jgi:hypothetical protein
LQDEGAATQHVAQDADEVLFVALEQGGIVEERNRGCGGHGSAEAIVCGVFRVSV